MASYGEIWSLFVQYPNRDQVLREIAPPNDLSDLRLALEVFDDQQLLVADRRNRSQFLLVERLDQLHDGASLRVTVPRRRIYVSLEGSGRTRQVAWYPGATAERIESAIAKACGLPAKTPIELVDGDVAVVISATLPHEHSFTAVPLTNGHAANGAGRLYIVGIRKEKCPPGKTTTLMSDIKSSILASQKFREAWGDKPSAQDVLLDSETKYLQDSLDKLESKESHAFKDDGAWKSVAAKFRHDLKLGDSNPWTSVNQIRGISPHWKRGIEQIDVGCAILADKVQQGACEAGLFRLPSDCGIDLSQNLNRGCFGPFLRRTLTTSTDNYSYEQQRRILAEENFAFQGFPQVRRKGMSDDECRELAGNAMCLATLGSILYPIIVLVPFPGLFESSNA